MKDKNGEANEDRDKDISVEIATWSTQQSMYVAPDRYLQKVDGVAGSAQQDKESRGKALGDHAHAA